MAKADEGGAMPPSHIQILEGEAARRAIEQQEMSLPAWGAAAPAYDMQDIVAAVRRAICEDLYPDGGFGTYERTFLADLKYLPLEDLAEQADRLRLRMFLEHRPSTWLIERTIAIQQQIELRRTGRLPAEHQSPPRNPALCPKCGNRWDEVAPDGDRCRRCHIFMKRKSSSPTKPPS